MKPPFSRTISLLLSMVLLLGFSACERISGDQSSKSASGADKAQEKKPQRKFSVRTQPVATRSVAYEIKTIGTLVEENEYQLPAQVPGVIEGQHFSEGDRVTSGQELCRIDYERYKLLVDQAQRAVAEQEAAVVKAEVDLADQQQKTSSVVETAKVDFDLAQSDYRRSAALRKNQYISTEEGQTVEAKYKRAQALYKYALTAAQTQVGVSSAALNQQRMVLESKRVALAVAEDQLRKAIVTAPITGVIQSRSVTNGQYVLAGAAIAKMVQTDPLRLRFTIPESKMSKVRDDMSVKFKVSAHLDREFEAKVYAVASTSDPESHEVECWARLPNPDSTLRPGYFAHVGVMVDSKEDAIVVPLGSVLPSENGMVAFVVQDGTAQRRRVETGLNVSGDAIEVVKGLELGEQLVVEGADTLQDKVPVQVVNKIGIVSAESSTSQKTETGDKETSGSHRQIGSD